MRSEKFVYAFIIHCEKFSAFVSRVCVSIFIDAGD